MAEDSGGNAGDAKTPGQPAQAATGQPHVIITHQYVKDLSFENPNAPESLLSAQELPRIEVNVDVQARTAQDSRFEVSLRVTANAKQDDATIFVVEVIYAGLFVLQNVPQDQIHAMCLIECPRLLFPYARRIVSDLTRDGGFPPLLLDPIDFAELFRHHIAQQEQAQAAAGKSAEDGNGAATPQQD